MNNALDVDRNLRDAFFESARARSDRSRNLLNTGWQICHIDCLNLAQGPSSYNLRLLDDQPPCVYDDQANEKSPRGAIGSHHRTVVCTFRHIGARGAATRYKEPAIQTAGSRGTGRSNHATGTLHVRCEVAMRLSGRDMACPQGSVQGPGLWCHDHTYPSRARREAECMQKLGRKADCKVPTERSIAMNALHLGSCRSADGASVAVCGVSPSKARRQSHCQC